MPSALVPASTLLVLALVAAGCASPDQPESAATPTPSPAASASPSPSGTPEAPATEPAVEAIPVTIRGDEVQPNGRRVEVAAGEPFTLAVDSDRTAELHVHSTPEQTVQVEPGRTEVPITVDTPGLVDVEEHDTGIVLLQLEVR